MSDPTIPEGMKAWAGGDSAPADWDGGPVLFRDGTVVDDEGMDAGWAWDHGHLGADIIAYTPALSTPTTPDENHVPDAGNMVEEARAREVLASCCDAIDGEIVREGSPYARVTTRSAIAAMLAFRPSEGEGLREAAIKGALCLSGFSGLGIFVEGFEDPADAYGTLVDALGMPNADDDDLRAALKGER